MTVDELKDWFEGRELPEGPVWIHKSLKVGDPKYFVQLHFNSIESAPSDRANEPLILRLIMLKEWMEANQK